MDTKAEKEVVEKKLDFTELSEKEAAAVAGGAGENAAPLPIGCQH